MASNRKTSPEEARKSTLIPGALAAVIFLSSGCVVSSDSPPEEETEGAPSSSEASPTEETSTSDPIASSVTTSTSLGADLQVDIYALERLENDLLRLRLGVTNNSSDSFDIGFGLSDTENHRSASSISLIDDVNQQRYLSYNQGNGKCFCSSLDEAIAGGNTENLWVIYPEPPGDLEKATITTPLTPPLLDVPISSSSGSVENTNLEDPQILDLTNISDSLEDDQTGRTESSDEVSIILSSDVLFDINSSDLSADAQDILEQVSQEIDDATSSEVSIDGHADNTGDDSINLPLSKERAESVESALNALITREGLTFEVEGHGSADPIADNETEEGRERNRRVSVTFEK